MVSKNRFTGSVAAIAVLTGGALYLSRARAVVPPAKPPGILAVSVAQEEGGYLPDPNRKYPERVLWGDEHVHTGWSVDAGLAGATLTPEDAVRFARGEMVKSNTGQEATLQRPLDWIAVTDHSDAMGTVGELTGGTPK